jgi:hypothetical protein
MTSSDEEGIMETNEENPHACVDRSLLISDVSRRSALKALVGAVGAMALASAPGATDVADALRNI